MYVFMLINTVSILIGKGQSAQKNNSGRRKRIKRNIYEFTYESYSCLNLRCSVTDASENDKRCILGKRRIAKFSIS